VVPRRLAHWWRVLLWAERRVCALAAKRAVEWVVCSAVKKVWNWGARMVVGTADRSVGASVAMWVYSRAANWVEDLVEMTAACWGAIKVDLMELLWVGWTAAM
jgi:hypothetical protein